MNERIKKLAEQAGLRFTQLMSNPMVPVVDGKETDLEKFAELLIKECISIVEEQKECLHEEQQYWHDRDYGYEMAVNDASKGIKQFFGVEE
jgi:hypothetical protein